MLVSSCHKKPKRYSWEPGISAPKYYPVAGTVDFGNAGNGSNTSFANGWGDDYGYVVGDKYKEIPKKVYIDYYSVVDGKGFHGEVPLPEEKLKALFENSTEDSFIRLIVGMAPGGWIRVWFANFNDETEIAKAQLKGYEDDSVGEGLKTKNFETWGSTYIYWQHHGIPYEAWAENEKEYDIYFDFSKPNHRKVEYNDVSADGTYGYGDGIGERFDHKLPVEIALSWVGKPQKQDVYCSKVLMPKNFKNYIEKKGLKSFRLRLEIEDNQEYAVLYFVSDKEKEKILRFRNKKPTAEEKKSSEYDYAPEIEYFIP